MIRTIAEVKVWPVEDIWEKEEPDEEKRGVVRRLEDNWKRFEKAGHKPLRKRPNRRQMQLEEWEDEGS